MAPDRVPLEASRSAETTGPADSADPPPSLAIAATIVARRRGDSNAGKRIEKILRGEAPPMPRDEADQALSADPADLRRITDFAAGYGLSVVEIERGRRTVRVAGTVAQMESAFGVKLRWDGKHLFYKGALTTPASLAGIVVAVLGLDQRPAASR
jgi:kumamolisin